MSKRFLPVLLLLATAALAGCGDDDGDDTAEDTSSDAPAASSDLGGLGAGLRTSPATTPPTRTSRPPRRTSRRRPLRPSAVEVDGHGEDHARRHDLHARRRQGALHSQLVRVAGAAELLQRHPLPPAHHPRTGGIAVLQCGDPTRPAAAGRATPIADEVDGSETYAPVSWPWPTAAPDTNGSQFFIVYDDSPLDPDYTVFGTVDDARVAGDQRPGGQGRLRRQRRPAMTAPKEDVEIEGITVG